jgi:outer membrane translocation and assembly module TamA
VLGVRGAAATTITGERPGPDIKIPPGFRQYLGGSRDLRGFGREELPANGLGGLSSVFGGVELRFGGPLPLGTQPLLFLDAGALGNAPWSLDHPAYVSPGFGARWESPIGVVRTSLAHGFILPGDTSVPDSFSHLQFYLSLGEEF